MKPYQGSCYCRRVTFEAELDLQTPGTYRCNCTSCFKRRWWGIHGKPAQFRVLSGVDELIKLKPAKGPGGVCRHCGVIPFISGDAAEWNEGDYVAINVAALDLDRAELDAAPIAYLDGLHDTWAPIDLAPRYL